MSYEFQNVLFGFENSLFFNIRKNDIGVVHYDFFIKDFFGIKIKLIPKTFDVPYMNISHKFQKFHGKNHPSLIQLITLHFIGYHEKIKKGLFASEFVIKKTVHVLQKNLLQQNNTFLIYQKSLFSHQNEKIKLTLKIKIIEYFRVNFKRIFHTSYLAII